MKSRTLTRPMFRIGGSAGTGITSGLDKPRQNYKNGSLDEKRKEVNDAALKFIVDNARASGQFTDDMPSNNMQLSGDRAVGGGTSLEDAIAMAKAKSGELSQTDPMSRREMAARFLIPFGLDFATRKPEGNLLATAAESAKGPVDMLFKGIDARKAAGTERESDLFNTFLSAGLEDRRYNRKMAAEKLKESQQLLTLFDKSRGENVIVKAADVYKNLENFGPAKADKDGRPFEKIEVGNKIEEIMSRIFELQNKEDRTVAEEQ